MRSSRSLVSFAACAALLLAPLAAWAQAPAAGQSSPEAQASSQVMPPPPPQEALPDSQTVVRLSDVVGTVRLSDSAGKLFDQVLRNMAMLPGMTLDTGNDGRAELEFPNGSVARITPNSAIALVTEGDANHTRLLLKAVKGLTYYDLAAGGSDAVAVGPLTARAPQAGNGQPVLLRVNLDSTPYEAAVLRGSVHFEDASGNATYDLQANETARIDPAAATNYDIVQDVTPDTWDAWNTDRENARTQVAAAAHPGGGSAGPGWNDLNYYGSWYDVPGEGEAWAPDGVSEDFDPYGSGAWGFYSTAGYGWVSSYPWGWLPYHCGLWNYYTSYGWMWRPGGCGWGVGAGWYPYSGIGSGPLRYRPPTRPRPPTGINHFPHPLSLIAVHQGPSVRFRQLGDPRPPARTLVVSGVPVQPLPVEARPSYRSVVSGEAFRSSTANGFRSGSNGLPQPAAPGYLTNGPGSGVGVSSHIMQAPHAPLYAAPAPRMSPPPPPPPPMAAPHMSAPSGGGHGH